MRPKRLPFFILVLGILVMTFAGLYSQFKGSTLAEIAANASVKLTEQAERCEMAASELLAAGPAMTSDRTEKFAEQKAGLYLFRNDSLLFWNNSQWAMNERPAFFKKEQGFAKLPHGYFIYCKKTTGDLTALSLSLIKPAYGLQNNYLSNQFCDWLGIPQETGIDTLLSGPAVKLNGQAIFGLKGSQEKYYDPGTDTVCLAFFIIGLCLLLLALLLLIRNGVSPLSLTCIIAGVALVRALLPLFRFPGFVYRTLLFDPSLFGNAQSYFSGFLGDILFNGILFLFASAALKYHLNPASRGKNLVFQTLLLAAFTFLLYNQFNRCMVSLVNNSTLNFNFLSIFSIKPPVFLALGALALMALALFVCLGVLAVGPGSRPGGKWLYPCLLVLICAFDIFVGPMDNPAYQFWLLPVGLLLYLLKKKSENAALLLGVYVLCVSLVTSAFLNYYVSRNQALDQKILTHQLGERQDEVLESEFAGLPERILLDESLGNLVSLLPESEKEIGQKLRQNYFNGYFYRYDVSFSLFDSMCHPLLNDLNPILLNEGFFEDQLRYYATKITDNLYFVRGHLNNTQYIGRIKLKEHTLYILMEAKQFEEIGSFPDLFLDRSLQKQDKLKTFAYAVYREGQKTSRYGDYNYPYFFQDSATLSKSSSGFIHTYFEPEKGTRIIISQPVKNGSYYFTFNSYLLLFFSLFTYCCYLVYALIFTQQFRSRSLTRRIQTIIILLLLLAMSAVGITSGHLVTTQFSAENKKTLEEKTGTIISELTGQFGAGQLFDGSQKELITARLREYSRLFNTPISLFDASGRLFTTSEPKLYDFGLAASYANPFAYALLSRNLRSAVSVSEKAGSLSYLSLYTPLFNRDKKIAGFINLPYFARQGDLSKELSEIISALINVYVILFVLSIVAGLILSGYITQPLRLIQQQLSKITLGRQNEKIQWESRDEIGKLVAEYNQMLLKLEASAELLAKSERESAWREMAKQVAHEIKNPLTPMKLNLQYLQHLMKSNPADFNERFEKASAGIIEQIDALATIATEFSNFAKLPAASLQRVNLAELIGSAVHVFENLDGLRLINHVPPVEIYALGDREQCLRVFNNILKNAVQATEGKAGALIEIGCEQSAETITISFKDNGCGIDEALKPRIFSPNFTTKSTGSGLGLAMVKNIMEGFGGSIRFESERDKGTAFYLAFKPSA